MLFKNEQKPLSTNQPVSSSKLYILICGGGEFYNIGAFYARVCVCCVVTMRALKTPAALLRRSFVRAPSVEALDEPLGLFVLQRQEELSRPFRLFDAHVLDVDLCGFVGQLDLDLAAARSQPQEHLLAVVQDHDVVVRQIVLAKVGTLLGDREVALLV